MVSGSHSYVCENTTKYKYFKFYGVSERKEFLNDACRQRCVPYLTGKTQEQVAEAVGLEPGTISRIERGAKGMSIDSLLMFSEIYGVSTDYILKGDKTVASSDALLEELGALVQKYKSL